MPSIDPVPHRSSVSGLRRPPLLLLLAVLTLVGTACWGDSEGAPPVTDPGGATTILAAGDEESGGTGAPLSTTAPVDAPTTAAGERFRANIGDTYYLGEDETSPIGLILFLESGTINVGDTFVTSGGTVGTVLAIAPYPEFVLTDQVTRDPDASFDPEIRIDIGDADIEAYVYQDTLTEAPAE